MKFKSAKHAHVWGDASRVWLLVERHLASLEKRAHDTGDPRLRALENVLYQMSQQFHKELHTRMDWIAKHQDEFLIETES